MEQDSSWSIGEDDIEWWNSYTRLFVQDLYSKDPKKEWLASISDQSIWKLLHSIIPVVTICF